MRRFLAGVGLMVLSGGLWLPPGVGAAAQGPVPVSFGALAGADGMRIGWVVPGFLAVEEFIDGGYPVARSTLDSLGTSRSLASAPYPGDTIVSNGPAAANLLGVPSPPPYPLLVESDPERGKQVVTQPGYQLEADASPSSSTARASAGYADDTAAVGYSLARAATVLAEDRSSVVAGAGNLTDGFRIGDQLVISGLRSTAEVTARAGAPLERKESLSVRAISVLGQSLALAEGGFVAAGQTVPVPADQVVGQLKQQGVELRYVAAAELADGVVAPALAVTVDTGVFALPGVPPGRITIVLGRATARARMGADPVAGVDSDPVGGGFGETLPVEAGSAASTEGATLPAGDSTLPALPARSIATDAFSPSRGFSLEDRGSAAAAPSASAAGEAATSTAGQPNTEQASPVQAVSDLPQTSLRSVFLAIAIGVVLALAGLALVRTFAARVVAP